MKIKMYKNMVKGKRYFVLKKTQHLWEKKKKHVLMQKKKRIWAEKKNVGRQWLGHKGKIMTKTFDIY